MKELKRIIKMRNHTVYLVSSLFFISTISFAQARTGAVQQDRAQGAAVSELQKLPEQDKDAFGTTPESRKAFTLMAKQLMPLTNKQIVSIHKLYNQTRKAVATFPGTPPKPSSTTIMVNLSPGSTPPVVRLQQGFVTSLVFLDSTGATWPISAYDVADPASFDIKFTTEQPGSLLIQTSNIYKISNLVVMLRGNSTPINITLVPGQKSVDYLDYMRVPGLGPNATPMLSSLPDASNPELLKVLDGVPPAGSKTLRVLGGSAQAWSVGSLLYIRTRATLLSPSWTATMSSPDGTNAYQLMAAPVVLVSSRGKMIQLMLEGL